MTLHKPTPHNFSYLSQLEQIVQFGTGFKMFRVQNHQKKRSLEQIKCVNRTTQRNFRNYIN